MSKIASLQLTTVARLKVLGENALNFYQRWISNQTSIELFCLEVKFVLQLLINWDQWKTELLYPSITCSKSTIKTLERDGGGEQYISRGRQSFARQYIRGNIPEGGNFPGGNFPEVNFLGGNLPRSNFTGETFALQWLHIKWHELHCKTAACKYILQIKMYTLVFVHLFAYVYKQCYYPSWRYQKISTSRQGILVQWKYSIAVRTF